MFIRGIPTATGEPQFECYGWLVVWVVVWLSSRICAVASSDAVHS